MNQHNFIISGGDTDAINFSKQDGSPFSKEEVDAIFKELNEISPEFMVWECDGVFDKVIVVRAKNYILYDGKKIIIKGSGLKVTMKETALKEMIKRFIDSMLELSKETPSEIYHSYVKEIHNIKDISRWCSKKTITASVLKPKRSNEQKVADALLGKGYTEGDKIKVYFKYDGERINEKISPKTGKVSRTKEKLFILKCEEDWDNDHSADKLLGKLYKNVQVFEKVLDMSLFPNFALSKNKKLLEEFLESNEDN